MTTRRNFDARSTPAQSAASLVHCGSCQRVCPIEAWRAMPALRTLTASEVGGYVSHWPDGVVVEVRPCSACGHAIARRQETVRLSA
jgi:hypothetical protein